MPNNMIATKPVQLLVEGNDDRQFFSALIDHMSLSDIEVQDFGGVNQLRPYLRTFVDTDSFANNVVSLGIIRDAEPSAQSAFQSVQGSLRNAGLAVPDHPARRAGDSPAVSVFVLPPSTGELEARLRSRAQDPEEIVQNRMAKASDEMSHYDSYEYIIVNENLELSVSRVQSIIFAERAKRVRQVGLHDFVSTLRRED